MSDWFPNLPEPKVDTYLYSNSANAGISAGAAMPTQLTSAIRGAEAGIDRGLGITQKIQNIEATGQQNEIRQNQINQLPITNGLEAANLEATQQQNTIRQHQIDQLPLTDQVNALKTQAEIEQQTANALKAKAEAQKLNLDITKQKNDAERDSRVMSYFAPSMDIGATLENIDNNFSDVARSVIKYDAKGNASLDPVLQPYISDLVYNAQKTGNPELIQQAQNITSKIEGIVNDSKEVKNPKAQFGFGSPVQAAAQPQETDPTQLVRKELDANAKKRAAEEASASGITADGKDSFDQGNPVGAKNEQVEPAANFKPNQEQFPPRSNFTFPARNAQEDSLAEDPQVKEYNDSVPEAQRLITDDSVDVAGAAYKAKFAQIVKSLPPELKKDPVALRNATTQAMNYVKQRGNINAKQQEKLDQARGFASSAKADVNNVNNIFTRLQDIIKKTGYAPPIGGSESLANTLAGITSQSGLSADDAVFIDQVNTELSNVGLVAGIQKLRETAGTAKAVDSDAEKKAATNLVFGPGQSIEKNLSALSVYKSQVQQADNINTIKDMYLKAGKSYAEADSAAARYQRANPYSLGTGKFNGFEYPVGNSRMQDPVEFVNKSLNFGRIGLAPRDSSGRIESQPAAQPKDIIPANPDRIIPKGVSGLDIPETHPEGASTALMHMVWGAESKGDPNAVGPEIPGQGTAKGLAQFMDATGKEWFSKSGFDEYEPFNPTKSAIASTNYMSWLLGQFGGNTRFAVAAYNAGPGNVSKAIQKADKHLGDTSWESVKLFLPKPEETVPYVDKVMGDDKTPAEVRKELYARVDKSFGKLGAPENADYAKENLSVDGLNMLKETEDAQTVEDIKGTPLHGYMVAALAPQNAQASTGEDEEDGPSFGDQLSSVMAQIKGGIQAIGVGGTRMAMLGGDDEFFATARMAAYGEDWNTATKTVRDAKERVFQDHKYLYRTGMAAGAVASIPLYAAAGAADLTVMGAAKLGAVSGFLEGEGGLLNRSISGTFGAIFGAALQKALPIGLDAGRAVINKAAQTVDQVSGKVAKILKKPGLATDLAPTRTVLNPAEKVVSKELSGLPKEDLVKGRATLQTDKDLSLADVTPEASLGAPLDLAAQQPGAAAAIRKGAGARLDQQNTRVTKALNKVSKDVEPEKAVSELDQGLRSKISARQQARRDAAEQTYGKVKEKLPIRLTKGKKAGEVRVFNGQEVKAIIEKNPEVKIAVQEAMQTAEGGSGTLPSNSFEVLKRARSELGKKAETASGGDKKIYLQAKKELTDAMEKDPKAGKAFARATAMYEKTSSKIEELTKNPLISKLLKKGDSTTTTDSEKAIDAVLNSGPAEIKTFMKLLSPDERELVRNAARGYIETQLGNRGTRAAGETKAFPDFTKNRVDQKLEAIFGDKGKTLVKSLVKERQITRNANEALQKGSQTFSRAARNESAKREITRGAIQAAGGSLTGSKANFFAGIAKEISGFKDLVLGNKVSEETSKEIANIILLDRSKGLRFLTNELNRRAEEEGWKVTKEQIRTRVQKYAGDLLARTTTSMTDSQETDTAMARRRIAAEKRMSN